MAGMFQGGANPAGSMPAAQQLGGSTTGASGSFSFNPYAATQAQGSQMMLPTATQNPQLSGSAYGGYSRQNPMSLLDFYQRIGSLYGG